MATAHPEMITEAELAAAFRRVNITVGKSYVYASMGGILPTGTMPLHDKATYPETAARDLFNSAKANREPEYQDGKVYRDKDGDVYQYDVKFDGTKRWFEPGESEPVQFEVPTRPLRYLG